jgi:hypothetical protein
MRLAIGCGALAVLPFAPVQDRSGPLVDRAGDDLSHRSRAEVTIAPIGDGGSHIEFSVALPDPRPTNAAIAKRLTDAGFATDGEDLAESVRAIGGALAGPKGTLMDGQTSVLRVVVVTFRR